MYTYIHKHSMDVILLISTQHHTAVITYKEMGEKQTKETELL